MYEASVDPDIDDQKQVFGAARSVGLGFLFLLAKDRRSRACWVWGWSRSVAWNCGRRTSVADWDWLVMKLLVNAIGALVIAAIAFLVFRDISRKTAVPRPKNEAIKRDLLSAMPSSAGYEIGKIVFVDKAVLVSASTTLVSQNLAAGNEIEDRLVKNGWKKVSTKLVRTEVYCKSPLVLKVAGPTSLAQARYSYYLEAS
jgi:hypothetical protein